MAMKTTKIILFLIVLALTTEIGNAQCSPSIVLPNILKDLITLNNFDGQQQGSTYPYFPRMFSAQPVVAYSISDIDITSPGSFINYYLDVIVSTMTIDFYFNAIQQNWTKVTVNMWLTSRTDIIARQDTILNIPPGQNITQVIPLNSYPDAKITTTSRHVLFIVGMYTSLLSENLTVSALSAGINPSFAIIQVNNGLSTYINNITISSIIFNPDASQFLSYSGTISYQNFQSKYFNLYNNFVPIYYYLIGISSLSTTKTNSRSFGYHLEVNGTILKSTTASSTITYNSIEFSYISIGVTTSSVCQSCNNNYISQSNCVTSCPTGTYPYQYTQGGKACLKCQSIVGQQLNDLANGCSCLPGYEILTVHQCISIATLPTNCTGQNVIQNGTQCICSPGTYNISSQCQSCPTGTSYNGTACQQSTLTCTQLNTILSSDGSKCICIIGFTNYSGSCLPTCTANANYSILNSKCQCNQQYMNISGICTPCQPDQTYNAQLKTCQCNMMNQAVNTEGKCACQDGYFNVSGFCIQCPPGTIYLNGACAPTSCQQNQVLSNGKCVCDSNSVKKGSVCIKCLNSTFPNTQTNNCDACIANCVTCTNAVTCTFCNTNYVFDISSKSCISSGVITPTVTISPRTGFPIYTWTAIVTDFVVNASTILPIKTRDQLASMISIDFGNYQPERVMFAQNPNNLNILRVVLDYRQLLPMSPFNLVFNFQQSSINLSSKTTITYNAANTAYATSIPD